MSMSHGANEDSVWASDEPDRASSSDSRLNGTHNSEKEYDSEPGDDDDRSTIGPLDERDGEQETSDTEFDIEKHSTAPPKKSTQASGGVSEVDENTYQSDGVPHHTRSAMKLEKRIEKLTHKHLVVNEKVPPQVSKYYEKNVKNEPGSEFYEMRYTAVTCEPDDFENDLYTLRQQLPQYQRETELLIGVTMYNEDSELLYRSLQGIFQNIKYLCSIKEDSVWGKDGWKKIVVAIISDGRKKVQPNILYAMTALGAYANRVAVTSVENEAGGHDHVLADIYEYTTRVPINLISPYRDSTQDNSMNMPPVQLLFCLKSENQKKINSHRWFFNAFGRVLNPNVCVLLDVGTKPGPESIYHLWRAFYINPNVGGACGEIVAMKGMYGENLINPLVAAQNFEYKISNILDKSLESIFGYITVLPGAFSAYRYKALQNDEQGEGPLQKYFMGDLKQGQTADIFTANMYLAEDRVLCWELVSKRNEAWILHYVRSAQAETDVPDQLAEFISQRRR